MCTICNKAVGWFTHEEAVFEKILEQLGYQEEKTGELKGVLEQLG